MPSETCSATCERRGTYPFDTLTQDQCSVSSDAIHIIKTLSNPTRLLVMARLAAGESTVSELTTVSGVNRLCLSQHLIRLRKDGMIQKRTHGRNTIYSLAHPKNLSVISALISTLGASFSPGLSIPTGRDAPPPKFKKLAMGAT